MKKLNGFWVFNSLAFYVAWLYFDETTTTDFFVPCALISAYYAYVFRKQKGGKP